MPWNKDDEKGGSDPVQGPWGQQPKGPRKPDNWGGGGNRGPGSGPPNLDDILNKAWETIKSSIGFGGGGTPSGGGSSSGSSASWAVPLALLAAFIAYKSVYQIQPDERGMVLRLGEYTRSVGPGLHFAVWPIEKMETLRVAAENQISIGDAGDEGLMLTGDENIVDIRFKVLWKISDPEKYLFKAADQESIVRAVSESAMREIVGRTPATDVLTNGKLVIQDEVTEIVQKTLDSYNIGVKITGIPLEGVDPPAQVIGAFEEVQKAKQDRVKFINEAEQYTNTKLRNAEGSQAKLIEDAKGYKAQAVANAKGEAQRFDQIYVQYVKAKDVTRERLYLETMEKVLANSNRVIVEQGKAGQGVVPYLALPTISTPPVVTPNANSQNNGSAQ
jgi:modulator of FtsH protease HflK